LADLLALIKELRNLSTGLEETRGPFNLCAQRPGQPDYSLMSPQTVGDSHFSYSVLIFSRLSRLADIDSRKELVPLIHTPPSRKRDSDKGPASNTSVTTVALSPSGSRM